MDLPDKIRSQLERASRDRGEALLGILDVEWKRLDPRVDPPEHGMGYANDEAHVLIVDRALVAQDAELLLLRRACLCTEATLVSAQLGEPFVPEVFAELDAQYVDLFEAIPGDVRDLLVRLAGEPDPNVISAVLADKAYPDSFIEAVADPVLREALEARVRRQE